MPQTIERRVINVFLVLGFDQTILHLTCRRAGEFEETRVVGWPEATESLCDIPTSRADRVADLIAEFEIPRRRFLRSKCNDFAAKFVNQLPRNKIAEVLDAHAAGTARLVPNPRTFEPLNL